MFWGACCEDTRILRPRYVWETESVAQKELNAAELDKENQEARQRVDQKRQEARIPGTEAFKDITNINLERTCQPSSRKRPLRPDQVYKYQKLKRGGRGKGAKAKEIDRFLLSQAYP